MKGETMKLKDAIKRIENGKIAKVTFIKKDGSVGVVHGRTGVHSHLKGGKSTVDHSKYLIVYDFSKGYRCVNKSTILTVNNEVIL